MDPSLARSRAGGGAGTLTTRVAAADGAAIRHGAEVLRAGGLVVFPTETVYGLGADARSGSAVARLYAAKARPRFNPLIAHFASAEAAEAQGRFDAAARRLAAAFWPGPLTLVVPARPECTVCDLARAGLTSVALRVPDHAVARALIAAAACPVVAPSANRSGRISPTEAGAALGDLDGRVDVVLDGGPTRVGLESTIVACLGPPALLRPGGVPRAAIEAVLGRSLDTAAVLGHALDNAQAGPVTAPGMLASHYAPRARVRLDATAAGPDEAVLDFAGALAGQGCAYLDLSRSGDLKAAAANLFGFLRRLDGQAPVIAVAPIPAEGLGEAIADRLARAAAPRGEAWPG